MPADARRRLQQAAAAHPAAERFRATRPAHDASAARRRQRGCLPRSTAAAAADQLAAIQQSIARIQEACQAPPLAPHEYRLLFEVMAKEISDNDLIGAQTLANITQRAQERGLDVRRDDVRFVLEVVSEADPWFEQGASANLFAGRFRNFVVARCRGQGLNLSADELDLIDAWFAGGTLPQSIELSQRPASKHSDGPSLSGACGPGLRRRRRPAAEERARARWWCSRRRTLPYSRAARRWSESERACAG